MIGLGDTRNPTCEHGTCGSLSVQWIGLATRPSVSAIWAVDFGDGAACSGQVSGEAGTIRTGALDAEDDVRVQFTRPTKQPYIAACGRGDLEAPNNTAQEVERGRYVDVSVCVDTDDDPGGAVRHAQVSQSSSSPTGFEASAQGLRTVLR